MAFQNQHLHLVTTGAAGFILKCIVLLLGHVILRVDEVDLKLQSVSCSVEAAAMGGQFHFQDREPERQTDMKNIQSTHIHCL